MQSVWHKIKAFLCCGEEEEEEERPALVIGEPFGFKHVNVDLAGLSEQEQTMINSRPVPVTYPIHTDGSSATAWLGRAKAHTRALSNSLESATTNAMTSVGAKGSGYSALPNGSTSMMQPHGVEEDETPLEMKELLPRGTGGPETNSSFTGKGSVETATAGCEEEEGFIRIK